MPVISIYRFNEADRALLRAAHAASMQYATVVMATHGDYVTAVYLTSGQAPTPQLRTHRLVAIADIINVD